MLEEPHLVPCAAGRHVEASLGGLRSESSDAVSCSRRGDETQEHDVALVSLERVGNHRAARGAHRGRCRLCSRANHSKRNRELVRSSRSSQGPEVIFFLRWLTGRRLRSYSRGEPWCSPRRVPGGGSEARLDLGVGRKRVGPHENPMPSELIRASSDGSGTNFAVF